MRTLKILHITDCYDAGVYSAINSLVLSTPNLEHHLLYTGKSKPPPSLFSSVRSYRSTTPLARVLETHSLMKDFSGDAIHLHSSRAGILGRLIKVSTPVIYQPHGVHFLDLSKRKILRVLSKRVEALLGRKSQGFLAISHYERQELSHLTKGKNAFLLSNAVSLPAQQVKRDLHKLKIVMNGRVHPVKDPKFFIETANEIRKIVTDAEFTWIGSGEELLETELRKSNIKVTGWLRPDQVNNELIKANIYLHSSVSDGLPYSILEAARLDLPVVARNIPHFQGYKLTLIRTPEEAAIEILKSFENPLHFERQVQISRELVNFHSLENRGAQYITALESLVHPID